MYLYAIPPNSFGSVGNGTDSKSWLHGDLLRCGDTTTGCKKLRWELKRAALADRYCCKSLTRQIVSDGGEKATRIHKGGPSVMVCVDKLRRKCSSRLESAAGRIQLRPAGTARRSSVAIAPRSAMVKV